MLGDAIREYLIETGTSQKELAEKLNYDRTMITKVVNGKRNLPESIDVKLARLHWKLALTIIDERSGGFISNILEDVPNLDLHPAAIKELLLKDLEEAIEELEELRLAKHIDPQKRRERAEKVWHEIKDVVDKGALMLGVLEEEFGLDRETLIKRHEMQVKKGER